MEGKVTIGKRTPIYKEIGRTPLDESKFAALFDVVYSEDGKEMHRHILLEAGSGDGTYIVAITNDGHIVFTRQYRAGHDFQVEFIGERREPNEEPGQSALRGLKEEGGYGTSRAIFLGKGPVLSGTTFQVTYFYLTIIETAGKQQLQVYDNPADQIFNEGSIQTFLVPLENAEAFIIGLLQTGSGDPKMLAALRLAINYLQRSPTEYVKFWLRIWQNRVRNWLKSKTKKEGEQNV